MNLKIVAISSEEKLTLVKRATARVENALAADRPLFVKQVIDLRGALSPSNLSRARGHPRRDRKQGTMKSALRVLCTPQC